MFFRVVFLAICVILVSCEYTNEKYPLDEQAALNDKPIADVPEIEVDDAVKDDDGEDAIDLSDSMESDMEADEEESDLNEGTLDEIKDAKPWFWRRRRRWYKKDTTMKKSLEMKDAYYWRRHRYYRRRGHLRRAYRRSLGKKDTTMADADDEDTFDEMKDAKPFLFWRRRRSWRRRRRWTIKKDMKTKKDTTTKIDKKKDTKTKKDSGN